MGNVKRYVVCVRNEGYEESLELRKIYQALEDREAEKDGLIRVIDEDEDYLYPSSWFLPIKLPSEIEAAIVEIAKA